MATYSDHDQRRLDQQSGAAIDRAQRLSTARLIAAAPELLAALKAAISIADEAREEWDKAPSGMRAGKLLIALSGHLKGYRPDIDSIHAVIARATGAPDAPCSHCGKPATYSGPCGIGGCPLGGDL